ncbi:DUF6049 family protein [Protaetiibacter mangrovi]|uniref:DUF6049 family protein n=2 Tax=Microbacteriaceae TaxID=85023 RepID=A0ABT1ZHK2_9MICO|nr:DUF6049 family protein [Protaetiibacter mangrovi]MCS0500065.1 DUF6049 family protein [Protaetiibacter mangrovi]
MTLGRAGRAFASTLLATGLVAGSAAVGWAASGPDASDPRTQPASAAITPGSGPVSASIVMPVTLPTTTTGLVSADDLERYTGPFGSLTRQLDAAAGTPVAIGLDPMILASIRVLGASAPESATQWLARLQATSNEVFLLAYGDADLVAAARTGTMADLAPSGFGFVLDEADFSEAQTATPTPAPSATTQPDPDAAPPYPSTDDLLAWTTELPRIAWPGEDVGSADLAALASAGYADVIVPSSSAGDPTAPLIALDGIQGIVADDELSDLLGAAITEGSPAARTAALDALDAAFAAETAAHPGRGVVLTVDRGWPYALPGLADALARLDATASVGLVTLGDILATAAVPGGIDDGTATPDRDAVFTGLADDAAAETSFSTVLDDPSVLLDERRLERIALYGLAWTASTSAWDRAVSDFHTRSAEIQSSVQLQSGSDVALLARNAEFKVAVSNSLPYAVTVRVVVDPQSPILRADRAIDLTVEPESTGTALVPVEAVANGEVEVLTSITSPTGVPLDSGHASVTVHAEWEGIGTLVIVIVLALVFAAGILRLVITRRRARAERRAGAEAAETAETSHD